MKKSPKLSQSVELNKITGEQKRIYKVQGIPCPTVEIKTRKAIQHAGYTLIDLDLDDAMFWLDEAHKLIGPSDSEHNAGNDTIFLHRDDIRPFRLIKALWYSAIVLYAKCFSEAKGRQVKLEKSNIPANLRALHQKIIDFRNTIVAHAGEGSWEGADVQLVLSPRAYGEWIWIRNNVRRLDFVDERGDEPNFSDLIIEAKKYVSEKRSFLEKSIKDEVLTEPINNWYEKAKDK